MDYFKPIFKITQSVYLSKRPLILNHFRDRVTEERAQNISQIYNSQQLGMYYGLFISLIALFLDKHLPFKIGIFRFAVEIIFFIDHWVGESGGVNFKSNALIDRTFLPALSMRTPKVGRERQPNEKKLGRVREMCEGEGEGEGTFIPVQFQSSNNYSTHCSKQNSQHYPQHVGQQPQKLCLMIWFTDSKGLWMFNYNFRMCTWRHQRSRRKRPRRTWERREVLFVICAVLDDVM